MDRKSTLRIKLTIPARLLTKENDSRGATEMRHILDRAFKVCIGRCTWQVPVVITATPHQFGIFAYLLKEKGKPEMLNGVEVELFEPTQAATPYFVDASDNGCQKLFAECLPVPINTVAES